MIELHNGAPILETTDANTPIVRQRRRHFPPSGSVLFGIIALFALSSPNAPFAFPIAEAGSGFRLCGLKLTMMLNAICKQKLCGYNFILKKRSLTPPLLNFDDSDQSEMMPERSIEEYFRYHFLPSDEFGGGNDVASEGKRNIEAGAVKRSYPYGAFGTSKKSGIANECCAKRCTLSYMKTYCCAGNENHDDEEPEGEDEGEQ